MVYVVDTTFIQLHFLIKFLLQSSGERTAPIRASSVCSMDTTLTRLSCVCGETSLYLPGRSVLRYQCCCCDCRRGLAVCTENGGPPYPPAPDLLYFPNRLQVLQGVDHLRCFTLLDGYPTRRIVATCCWTALLGDHPSYDSVRLVTYPNPAIFTPHQERPVDKRIFQGDMSLAELEALGLEPDQSLQPDRA